MSAPGLGGATRLVGILGWPVSHSLSPRMQNAAFSAARLDWAYVPLPVAPGRVGEAVRGLVALGFAGANVTIPHKVAVMALCDEVDPHAAAAGSVNTLVVDDARVLGSSTDGRGVDRIDPAGSDVLIMGAGGAARPVAVALLGRGAASVVFAARRVEAARTLADELRAQFPGRRVEAARSWPPSVEAGVIVNATPIKDEVPVDPAKHQRIVDLAYRADGSPTALVARARDVGCETVVDGLEFLIRQGAASFEQWTGVPAPTDAMRDALRVQAHRGPWVGASER